MMKLHSRILYALISISLPLFTTGAQADGYYAGIARGQSEFNSDISVSKGATIDNKSSVGQVFFGREFDNNVAVEAFYANLGKAKLSAKKGSTVSAGGKTVSVNEDTNVTGSTTSFGIAVNIISMSMRVSGSAPSLVCILGNQNIAYPAKLRIFGRAMTALMPWPVSALNMRSATRWPSWLATTDSPSMMTMHPSPILA